MFFQKIDRKLWPRRDFFEHYLHNIPCTYSMTVKIDISRIRQKHLKLYPTMLYALSSIVNKHEEFRMAFDDCGDLGVYDILHPSYTVFHNQSCTFSNIWTHYDPDYGRFLQSYRRDLTDFGNIEGLAGKPNTPINSFTVSMIPWFSFEGFNLNLPKGSDYLLPIFTMGKFSTEGERTFLPLAIQVHHAVCDGFHTCRFLNELQEMLDQIFFFDHGHENH